MSKNQDRVVLAPSELKNLMDFATGIYNHKDARPRLITYLCNCDVTITHADGGGIGTRTLVKCGCGAEADITDYALW
jgi:hypothetical protein